MQLKNILIYRENNNDLLYNLIFMIIYQFIED